MLAVMILAGPLGNVLLGKGMKGIGAPVIWPLAGLLHTAGMILASGSIWLGVGSLITFFVAYMLVLSWADYSFVQPASSLSYGVVALLGFLMLGERVSPMRWAGRCETLPPTMHSRPWLWTCRANRIWSCRCTAPIHAPSTRRAKRFGRASPFICRSS